MLSSQFVNLILGAAALGYIAYRQLQVRPAKATMRLPVILGVFGVIQLARFLGQHAHHPAGISAALAGSLLIAALFAMLRAATVHVWVNNGQAWRQGNVLTVILWIVSAGLHLGFDYIDDRGDLAGLGAATLPLFLSVTFILQRLMILARARRIDHGERRGPDSHMHIRWP